MDPRESDICLVFDFNHLAWRNFFSNRELITKKGEGTAVPFGILRSLKMMCDKFKPVRVIMCKDKGKSWRRSAIPDYKSHRDEKDEKEKEERKEFYRQLSKTEAILESLGVPVVSYDTLEADDLCALASGPFRMENEYVIVVSGDKDLFQLVSEDTGYFHPHYGVLVSLDGWKAEPDLDEAEFKKRFNREKIVHPDTFTLRSEKLGSSIPQDRWLLYRALVGDSADNLPGIPGIGPKMAKKIVDVAGTPEEIEEAIRDKRLKGKKIEAIQAKEVALQQAIIDMNFLIEDHDLLSTVKESFYESAYNPIPANKLIFESFLKELELYSILKSISSFVKNIPNANSHFSRPSTSSV